MYIWQPLRSVIPLEVINEFYLLYFLKNFCHKQLRLQLRYYIHSQDFIVSLWLDKKHISVILRAEYLKIHKLSTLQWGKKSCNSLSAQSLYE